MADFLKLYIATFGVLLACDSIWLLVIAKKFYANYLGYILAPQVNLWPAALFYGVYAVGLIYFVIQPSLKSGSLTQAIFSGAFLGFLSYAAYDLTNQSTIKAWPWQITLIDMMWGTFLSALVSAVVFSFFKR